MTLLIIIAIIIAGTMFVCFKNVELKFVPIQYNYWIDDEETFKHWFE